MSLFIAKNRWPNTELARHFCCFATRTRELVHPTAQDIYRVHALSTLEKISELERCSVEVMQGRYGRKALENVASEVNEALESDPISNEILRSQGIKREAISILPSDTTENLRSSAQLWNGLLRDRYRNVLEQEILKAIIDIKQKKRILLLSKMYVSTLIGLGFHRRYILEMVEMHFFESDIGKCTIKRIERFFDAFPSKSQDFELFFVGDKETVSRLSDHFGLSTFEENEKLEKKHSLKCPSGVELGVDKPAFHWPDISGRDPYDATSKIGILLNLPSSFNVVYPSEGPPTPSDRCIVRHKKRKTVSLVERNELNAPVHSYTSIAKPSAELFKKFASFNWASLETDSQAYRRLYFSLNSASSALRLESPETQLVTVWSAFEALLPPPSQDENSARITHFAELIVPAVVRKYVKGKYRIFLDDLPRHSSCDVDSILGYAGDRAKQTRTFYDALVADGDICDELFSGVADSALALNRINSLFEMAKSPKSIVAKIKSHEKRVTWQVHRIYRERNSIVHSGRSSKALPVLVENSFLYYRLVLRALQFVWERFEVYEPHAALQLISGRYRDSVGEMEQIASKEDDKNERRRKASELVFLD